MRGTRGCFVLMFVIGALLLTEKASAFVVVSTRSRGQGININHEAGAVVGNSRVPLSAKKKADTATAAKKDAPTAMKRSEFVSMLAEEASWTKKQADENLTAVLNAIKEGVNRGYKVNFNGFGSFTPKLRAQRKGRNPQTGEEITIPESISPTFSAAKGWKDELKELNK